MTEDNPVAGGSKPEPTPRDEVARDIGRASVPPPSKATPPPAATPVAKPIPPAPPLARINPPPPPAKASAPVKATPAAARASAPPPAGPPPRASAPARPSAPPPPARATEPLDPTRELTPKQKRSRLRNTIVFVIAIFIMVSGVGLAAGTYYVDSVPAPDELPLPEATTVFYADGKTPMAKLGVENRTILKYDEMNDAVKQAIVAAEDTTFWTNEGIDFKGVMRAAWNNFSGGATQGASTITQQYARLAAELKGVTYSRKLREAVIAWKMTDKYSKAEILGFYLNTVPFGRGTYGIEAAAQVFLGKTANKNAPAAQQVTLAEAMLLAAMVKQPERDPADPENYPGYDPTRNAIALQNSKGRWSYIKGALPTVASGPGAPPAVSAAQAAGLKYPENVVRPFDADAVASGLDKPTGIVVSHALSELRQHEKFRDLPVDAIANGGYRIITTIDKAAQTAAEDAANIRGDKAPEALRGQPANWQAALAAVEPGTGRVVAYYGGPSGNGADYAGWYYDEDGDPRGFGQHPPGSTFKVFDLMEAQRQGIPLSTVYDSPPSKEFPNSARTSKFPAGPVTNASTAECQPNCTLTQATVASLNVPFFELTEQLGAHAVIDSAIKAGIDDMWANVPGKPAPVRVDLRGKSGSDVAAQFSTEVGIGQYGVTVVDMANAMATVGAGGKRAPMHFVKQVTKGENTEYEEQIATTDVGLTQDQIIELNDTLSQVGTAKLDNGWDSGGKTGTWQYGNSKTQNAHTWMVGYTQALAAAVWVGTTDGKPLITKDKKTNVFGSTYPGPIWQQFMRAALDTMGLDSAKQKFPVPPTPTETPTPTPSETPTSDPSASPTETGEPTGSVDPSVTLVPSITASVPPISTPPPAGG